MFDVNHIISAGGLLFLGLFIFAEVGLFLGFFLPGDTLLITAGVLAKEGKFSVLMVILVAAVAAIAGDNLAYFIGRKAGPSVFKKEDSIIFNPKHITKAEVFYEKYGPKTLLISHFVPVVRTFTPLLAGVAKMNHRKFFVFNATGDIIWAVVVTLLGYYVASKIPNIDHYLLLAIGFVIACSITPTVYHLVKRQLKKSKAKDKSTNSTEEK